MGCTSCQERGRLKAIKKGEHKRLTLELAGNTNGLSDRDLCPLCCEHLRYYCKNGCVGDKQGCSKLLESNKNKEGADADVEPEPQIS